MALTDKEISALYFEALGSQHLREQDRKTVTRFACAVEAEVQKQDEALIRQLVEALEVTASDVCQVAHHKKRDQHGNGDVCPVQARHDEAIAAGRARLEGDHIAHARNMVQIAVEPDEVLLALKRPEGYEDVHPELVAADALPSTPFAYRVAWPLELEP